MTKLAEDGIAHDCPLQIHFLRDNVVSGDLLQQLQAAGTADPIIDLTSKLISANIYPPKSQVTHSIPHHAILFSLGSKEKGGKFIACHSHFRFFQPLIRVCKRLLVRPSQF